MSPVEPSRTPASVRERILDYLHNHPTVTAGDLSRAWGRTCADIRYHLNTLLEEGVIELAPRDPSQILQRGRPIQSYRLAARSAPHNFPTLCSALLTAFLSPNESDSRLEELAGALAGGVTPPANLTRRYNQAVEKLNGMQFHARWEAHAGGARIILRNCPYAAILEQHPELCLLDQHLLEKLSGASVE